MHIIKYFVFLCDWTFHCLKFQRTRNKYFWGSVFHTLKWNEWFYVSNFSSVRHLAIITQESQDNHSDLSDDGDDDFPVDSGSGIESGNWGGEY